MAQTTRGRTRIRFVFEGIEYDIDLDKELAVNRENLALDFAEQMGKYSFYATAYAAAQIAVERADLHLSITKAREAAALRAIPSGQDSKGKDKFLSEGAIDKELDRREAVIAAKEALLDARLQEYALRAAKDAFQHRRDMLIQLGYDARAELRM